MAIEPGIYKHHKGGLYTVLFEARESTNGPTEGLQTVIYVSHTTGLPCTRLLKEFLGQVRIETSTGVVFIPRFERVSNV